MYPLKKPFKQNYPEIVETKSGDLDEGLHGIHLKGAVLYKNAAAKENTRKISTCSSTASSKYKHSTSSSSGVVNATAIRKQLETQAKEYIQNRNRSSNLGSKSVSQSSYQIPLKKQGSQTLANNFGCIYSHKNAGGAPIKLNSQRAVIGSAKKVS